MKLKISELNEEFLRFIRGSLSISKSNNGLSVRLPETFDFGGYLEVKILFRENRVTFYNNTYIEFLEIIKKNIEDKFENTNVREYIKKHYLENSNTKDNIVQIKKELFTKYKIKETSLLQEQDWYINSDIDYFELCSNLLQYSFAIKLYYNNLFHYILLNTKGNKNKRMIIDEVFNKYLENLSKTYSRPIEKISNDKIYSKNSSYYKIDNTILTINNNKVSFVESLLDFEELYKAKEYDGAILIANIASTDLNVEYIEKFKNKLKQLKIVYDFVNVDQKHNSIEKIEKIEKILKDKK